MHSSPGQGWLLFARHYYLFRQSVYNGFYRDRLACGAITPIGGTAFIAGWILLVIAVIRA
ncbi:hypothetical protein [Sinobaca sp. H24]|uniref:hypothetical protein n=1 Tax=Sinobaca sp. H24 TaxID=2923376 RepID=UPI00207AE050|nr:hypothetical protein [Sinobaca sp. H24]